MPTLKRVTFVWNADFSLASGIRALKEAVEGHHSCTLCEIAYHRVTQTSEWKAYKKHLAVTLGAEVREPCRNQLSAAELTAAGADFPAVLIHTTTEVVKLLGRRDIDACHGEFASFKTKLDAALSRLT